MDGVRDGMFLKKSNQIISDPGKILWAVTDEKLVAHDFFLVTICMDENQRKEKICILENTSWKALAYGIYARLVDVSEIERVSAANE